MEDEADYRARLDAFFAHAHVIKLSGADLEWIAPGEDIAALAAGWLAEEARIVLSRGRRGRDDLCAAGRITRPARR